MTSQSPHTQVVPAHVDFLTLYNSSFSTSEHDLEEQILYYHDRKLNRRNKQQENPDRLGEPRQDEGQNEHLRKIGLAQGMVQFAKNFSPNSDVDTIETEKSRIVLKELEPDWWMLASINLTCLPRSRAVNDASSEPTYEYSAREVSPAPLLLTQLVQAHSLFLLHHATSLQELYEKFGKKTVCDLLERYWSSYVQTWDVLLHGNPAAAIFDATKLSGNGELGVGVGEEEWGSGEREVLEGFVDRTEGLLDLVVGRYGPPPSSESMKDDKPHQKQEMWLGGGADAAAADGVVFSGRGLISRKSLRTIAQWMETIFKHGDDAYGVNSNPRAPTRRTKRRKLSPQPSNRMTMTRQDQKETMDSQISHRKPSQPRAEQTAGDTSTLVIPPPLVRASPSSSPPRGPHSISVNQQKPNRSATSDAVGKHDPAFGAESMMKYLTLGYGTAWTLNPKGLKSDTTATVDVTNTVRAGPLDPQRIESKSRAKADDAKTPREDLQHVDPAPELSDTEAPYQQQHEQTTGEFLIGLTGDLEQTDLHGQDEEREDSADEDAHARQNRRIFLRTLNVEMARPKSREHNLTVSNRRSKESLSSMKTSETKRSQAGCVRDFAGCSSVKSYSTNEPKTSAAASIDGSQPSIQHEKVQVAVYVHQPFVFVFLFALHTPSLTMPAFYRSIHHQLGPLQRPLLSSTDPSRMHKRMAEALDGRKLDQSLSTNPIYDLIYDPARMTLRTTIPNIPQLSIPPNSKSEPASVSVSGSWYTLGIPLGTSHDTAVQSPVTTSSTPGAANSRNSPLWSRPEAVSTHAQLLSLYASTRSSNTLETTVKTTRGFWVCWIKIIPSRLQKAEHVISGSRIALENKEAILVRKSVEKEGLKEGKDRGASGRWLLREQRRDVSNTSSAVSGTAGMKSVGEGLGIDVKRWVDGLLSFSS